MSKAKLGTFLNPYRADQNGSASIVAAKPGTVWIILPGEGLLSLDCYGGTPELVVYGDAPILIRTSGAPLDSGTLYTPKRSA